MAVALFKACYRRRFLGHYNNRSRSGSTTSEWWFFFFGGLSRATENSCNYSASLLTLHEFVTYISFITNREAAW